MRDEEAARAAVLHRLSVERDALEREEARAKARQAELETRLAQASRDLAREEEHIAEAEGMLRGLGEEARRLAAASSRDHEEPQLREAAAIAAERARQRRRPPSAPRPKIWRGRAPSAAASMPSKTELEQRIALLTRQSGDIAEELAKLEAASGGETNLAGAQRRACQAVRPGRGAGSRACCRPKPARKLRRRAKPSPEPRLRAPSFTCRSCTPSLPRC